MTRTGARRAFAEMMQRAEREINLAEAALLIAKTEDPRLLVPLYLERLDELAAAVARRLPPGASERETLAALNDYLFQVEGFAGNQEAYYDPRNSFLNEVLDRRMGIPITLSVVYIEVGRRLGLTLDGIGYPYHFLVRYTDASETFFVDVFNGGQVRTEAECRAELAVMANGDEAFVKMHLAALTKRQILTRLLHNLKAIYLKTEDYRRAARIVDLLLLVNPSALDELRDRGLIYARLGQYVLALRDLETCYAYADSGPGSRPLRRQIDAVWRRYARLN